MLPLMKCVNKINKITIVAFMCYVTNNYYALPTYVYIYFLRRHCRNTKEVKRICLKDTGVRDIVFNDTFNNISAVSWLSAFLMEETGGPGKNHRPPVSH